MMTDKPATQDSESGSRGDISSEFIQETQTNHSQTTLENLEILDSEEEKTGLNEKTSQQSPTRESQDSSETQSTITAAQQAQIISNQNLERSQQLALQANLEQKLQKYERDLESMVLKYAKSERENLQNKTKVDDLDRKLKRAIKDNDSLANRIKLLTNDKNQLADTLNAKLAQLTVLEQKNLSLNTVQDVKLKELEDKIVQLEKSNVDLLKQIETYKSKEGELLDFSERLSMKHLLLQTELDKALQQAPEQKAHYEQLIQERNNILEQQNGFLKQIESLNGELMKEKRNNEILQKSKDEMEIRHQRSIEELENEMKMMRRKHQLVVKELLKQVKHLQAELMGQLNTQSNNILASG